MATTTNFGWNTPDDTDLVKDGALAIRTLGSDIDTALVDLKGGSTGQSLVKNSGTDLDYAWADNFAAGKNRITNGNMVIDQRSTNATFSNSSYLLDRFRIFFPSGSTSTFTINQDSSAPTGFSKSLKVLTAATDDFSGNTTRAYFIAQKIEGNNVIDFDYGTANAKTATLSFYVRSSLTGTFGGSLRNSASNRSYVFSYTINAADTWEKKTITIPGDTTGTWLNDTGTGIEVCWSIGAASDRVNTANAWYAANHTGVTGQTQLCGTLNATWFISGVQFELGSVATAFQTATGTLAGELAACQRYYYRFIPTAAGNSYGPGFCDTTTLAEIYTNFPVQMRTNPSALEQSGTAGDYSLRISGTTVNCSAVPTLTGAVSPYGARTLFTVASGLTAGAAVMSRVVNTSGYLGWSAEL